MLVGRGLRRKYQAPQIRTPACARLSTAAFGPAHGNPARLRCSLGRCRRPAARQNPKDQLDDQRDQTAENTAEQTAEDGTHCLPLAKKESLAGANRKPRSSRPRIPPARAGTGRLLQRAAHENTRRSGYFQKNAAITYSRLSTTIGRVGLTTVFGMVTGVSPHVCSPQRPIIRTACIASRGSIADFFGLPSRTRAASSSSRCKRGRAADDTGLGEGKIRRRTPHREGTRRLH